MGGRIDHTVSNLNTLLTHMHLRIVLLGDSSTARLLPAGSCSIRPAPVWVNPNRMLSLMLLTACAQLPY